MLSNPHNLHHCYPRILEATLQQNGHSLVSPSSNAFLTLQVPDIFNLFPLYLDISLLVALKPEPPGGGGTPIWNRRGCLSEMLNLTPKGDHLGAA